METTKIAVFRGKQIRRHWDDNQHNWFFSVVDVIAALTDSENPAVYWRVLKKRLKDEGADQTVTKCNGLKMPAADGRMRYFLSRPLAGFRVPILFFNSKLNTQNSKLLNVIARPA